VPASQMSVVKGVWFEGVWFGLHFFLMFNYFILDIGGVCVEG